MEEEWRSVEQVAERLGLHVRTVRGYIRDGRLKAVRIGKQYRIAQGDLDAFIGRPAEAVRSRAEVSAVVEFEGITAAAADRLSTLLVAGAQLASSLRVQTVHDTTLGRLKVIIVGGVGAAAEVLRIIDDVLGSENGLLGPLNSELPATDSPRSGGTQ
jgi:excisionase family DNA binding protein